MDFLDVDHIDILDMDDLNEIEEIEALGAPRRRSNNIDRERKDPFSLSEKEFKGKYRFSKRYAHRIIELIRETIKRDPRGCPVLPELQVLCALRCWARHEIQDDAGDLHGISQPSVSVICNRVATALANQSNLFIKMPVSIQEQQDKMREFRAIANFPSVIGAIDGTHIKIKKVSAEGGQIFINRKGFSSVNVQMVCDANLRIMDVVTRWHGSAHDSRIFRECRLKQRFEAGEFTGILLGDSGYPCTSYLFTPVRNPNTPQEQRYNRAHILTRNTIERCFGNLKQRFRGLLRGMFGNIDTAKKTIVACAVLHNIAIDMKEEIYESSDDEDDDDHDDEDDNHDDEDNDEDDIRLSAQFDLGAVRGNLRRTQFIEHNF